MATFIKSLTVSIDSNSTLSEAIQLGENGYDRVFVEVPTMSTAAALRVYGSGDGTSYKYIHGSDLHSSTVGGTTMIVQSAPNGAIVNLPTWMPYMKLQVTGTVCASCDFKIFAVLNQ